MKVFVWEHCKVREKLATAIKKVFKADATHKVLQLLKLKFNHSNINFLFHFSLLLWISYSNLCQYYGITLAFNVETMKQVLSWDETWNFNHKALFCRKLQNFPCRLRDKKSVSIRVTSWKCLFSSSNGSLRIWLVGIFSPSSCFRIVEPAVCPFQDLLDALA